MSLSEARYHDLVDAVQESVEDVFDDTSLDVDLENSGGVLTVRFDNDRGLPRRWRSAPGVAVDMSAEALHAGPLRIGVAGAGAIGCTLAALLARTVREQTGAAVDFAAL